MGIQGKVRKWSKATAILLVLTLLAGLFASCGKGGNNSDEGDDYTYDPEKIAVFEEDPSGMEYASNIILVYFDDGATDDDKDDVVSQVDGEVVGRFDTLNQYQIRIEARSYEELKELCRELEELECVAAAAVDQKAVSDQEPYYPSDGYSDNWDDEYPAGQNWGQEAIDAPYAWAYREYAETIPVAIIDSGFATSHSDLKGVINIASGCGSESAEPDHGTFVAGIVGAGFDNGTGISGMAPNASMTGYPIGKKSSSSNELFGYVLQAVKDGNKVINLSFGSSASLNDCYSTWDYNDEGKIASLQISRLLDQGYDFLIVQSAGNGAKDHKGVDAVYNGMFCSITSSNCYTDKHSYSDIMEHVIVAGAAERTSYGYQLAAYSNGGSNVTVCAPGSDIYGLDSNGGCRYGNGTSYSAPFVTGTAALIWGLDTSRPVGDIKLILKDSSDEPVPANSDSPSVSGSYDMINAGTAAWLAAPEKLEPEPSTAEEAFQMFLQDGYDSANDYYQDMPIHYDEWDDGSVHSDGGTTWIEYAVADFDADGQLELLLHQTFYTGEYSPDASGSLLLYEWEGGSNVELKNFCYFRGDLSNDEEVAFYDSLVIYENTVDEDSGVGYWNLYVFSDDVRNRFGMKDGDYISYPIDLEFDFADVDRHICSAFSIDDIETLSDEEFMNETDSILSGNIIDVELHPVTADGISAGF